MSFIPSKFTDVHSTEVPLEAKFSLKPSCKFCSNEFNDKDRIPKLLQCGHTFCSSCIRKSVESNKFSYSGDGDVFRHFNCFTRKKQSEIDTNKSDYGFPSNFQLMEVLQPNDTRSLKCIECLVDCNECMMQICRICTFDKFNFDIVDIDKQNSVTDPDNFAICSACILKNHNNHCYIDFYPIRRYWHFKNVLRDVNVAKANYDKFFCEAREVMDKTPRLLSRLQDETSRMVELMSYAKSSHQLKYMEKRYEEEMKKVVGVSKCIKDSLIKLNSDLENNSLALRDENDNLKGTACDEKKMDIGDVFKVFDPPTIVFQAPILFVKNVFELVWLSVSWATKVTLDEAHKLIQKQKAKYI
ncbi:unnamed protein product [Caenorhabditis angaria]|uniref:RING-type domain-containing protein n=1 Tax=Caenorhabditis angaria TaxID=860376 RepID=A0A9P1IJE1_9PELO|nr:unnamed protein product [Caenorhabditis angaria]